MGRVASSSPSDGPVISAAAEVWREPDTRAAGAHARMGSDSQTQRHLLGCSSGKQASGPSCSHSCLPGQVQLPPLTPSLRAQPLETHVLLWVFMGSPSLWSTGQFQVMGPRSPVIAVVGTGAEFPCRLSPSTDAQHMEVRWFHGNHSGLVHYYRDSKDYLEQQRPEYHGRTELLRENITRGQVALRIHPIRLADEGDYRCLFVSSTYHNEARFHVEVTVTGKSVPQFSQARSAPQPVQQGMANLTEGPDHIQEHSGSGSTPHIHVQTDDADGLKLTCTSMGWYPEPEVHWEDSLEQHLTPASETKTTDGDGLFEVQTSIMVDKSLSANVSCFIRNPVLSSQKGVCVSLAGSPFATSSLPTCRSTAGLWTFTLLFPPPPCTQLDATPACTDISIVPSGKPCLRHLYQVSHSVCVTLVMHVIVGGSCTWMVVLAVLVSVLVLTAAICAVFLLARKDKEEIEQEKAALLEKCGLNKIRKFAEDIILDKDTAHPYLAVSPDGKCVKSVTKKQDVPDKPERFDTMPAVLGRNRFSSGSHYWEVEVAGNSKWTVGICVESVNRKGQYISAKTQSGFWTLCLKDGTYKALSVSHHVLQVTGPLLRVGIFLQYKEGLISFYNVTECTILHTFKSEFTEPLRLYFYPEPAGEKSTNGLTIVKVPAADPAVPL
ncbi:butyrophilin subfamily 1 member A1-like [Marmota flaviventris]|uniref:butyrophilin subfamily 1 member A1-like n=1 Tax=Marmota flaviventris TaxID=93162 RepID=UPI003A847904